MPTSHTYQPPTNATMRREGGGIDRTYSSRIVVHIIVFVGCGGGGFGCKRRSLFFLPSHFGSKRGSDAIRVFDPEMAFHSSLIGAIGGGQLQPAVSHQCHAFALLWMFSFPLLLSSNMPHFFSFSLFPDLFRKLSPLASLSRLRFPTLL